MVKLLFFGFRVTNSMCVFLFSHFRVRNVKLINEKSSLNTTVSKCMDCVILLRFFVFSLLYCKYICDIYLSATYLFTRLQKTLSSCDSKEEWPHTGLYDWKAIEGKQNFLIGLIVDRLPGPRLMPLWNAWGCC